MARILCIEDSKEFQIYLTSILREHALTHVATIADALRVVRSASNPFDLVLLDISLPDGNGMKVLPELKEALGGPNVPFIVISADNDTLTKVAAFGVGADDFVVKPPDSSEFKARVDAKLRWANSRTDKQSILIYEDLSVDLEKLSAEWIRDGGTRQTLDLTPYEFKILKLLMSRPGQVFSRDQIIERIWGIGKFITPRTIDAHVSHLRSKISGSQVQVETVLSAGYKISKRDN